MGEFLKPWRRKAGCVLLIAATATITLLDLSLRYGLWGAIVPGESYAVKVLIDDASMMLIHDWDDFSGEKVFHGGAWESNCGTITMAQTIDMLDGTWVWKPYLGFTHTELHNTRVMISLWLIAIPSTVLSAVLLLWPSRKQPERVRLVAQNP